MVSTQLVLLSLLLASALLAVARLRQASPSLRACAAGAGRWAFLLTIGAAAACLPEIMISSDSGDVFECTATLLIFGLTTIAWTAQARWRQPGLAQTVAPSLLLTLLALLAATAYQRSDTVEALTTTWLTSLHLAGAAAGQGFALLAFLLASAYAWQRQLLKAKRIDVLSSAMPALDQLEDALLRSLMLGWGYLSCALISGFFLPSGKILSESTTWFPVKAIWAWGVWTWYTAVLGARLWGRVSGEQIARRSVIGFILLASCFFGAVFMSGGQHG